MFSVVLSNVMLLFWQPLSWFNLTFRGAVLQFPTAVVVLMCCDMEADINSVPVRRNLSPISEFLKQVFCTSCRPKAATNRIGKHSVSLFQVCWTLLTSENEAVV